MEFTGFHGTDSANLERIQEDNFQTSRSDAEWLGFGVYFFIDGICCPISSAEEWATATAWDKTTRTYRYDSYSVLSVTISGEEVLDLRDQNDLKHFNLLRNVLYRTHDQHFLEAGRYSKEHDRILINMIIDKLDLDIVVGNLYVKSIYQRMKGMESRIPNVTVLCVMKNENIDISTLEVCKEGSIE